MPEAEITKKLFELKPLSFLPLDEKIEIITKHSNPMQALHFVERHFNSYKKYLRQKDVSENLDKKP